MTIELPDLYEAAKPLGPRMTPDIMAEQTGNFVRHPMARHVGEQIAKHVDQGQLTGNPWYLMLEAPPRHGKSYLVSQKTPPWFLQRWPGANVAIVTYESNFSASWGRKVRDEIEQYGKPYGLEVRSDSRSISDFHLTNGSNVFCTGIGGPLTGRGFQIIIIDDPIKNAEEAASQTIREKHWDWWQSTASTRLEPGGGVVLMMTRWNEDDLAGRLIKAGKDDPLAPQWERYRYPAIAEEDDDLGRSPGEALWPERFDLKQLEGIKRRSGTYYWAAMFQQRPAPLEGGLFERRWFLEVEAPCQAHMPRVRAWDLAGSERKGADWSVGVLWCRSPTTPETVRLEDVHRFQGRPHDVDQEMLATAMEDGPSVIIQIQQDPGEAGVARVEALKRLLRGYPVEVYRPTGDKETRARPLSAKAQAGFIEYVPGDWCDAFFNEAAMFPNGAHDDQIDAASAGLQLIETMAPRRFFHLPEDSNAATRNQTAKLLADMTPRRGRSRSDYRRVFRGW